MLKKILRALGFVPLKELNEVEKKHEQLKNELSVSQQVVKDLKTDLFVAKQRKELPHPVVGIGLKDVEPTDEEKRKLFVGQVAGFHMDIMKGKLIAMIADARGQFEQINRETFGLSQDAYDLFLKGTINGLWLIHDWGEQMVNEQLSYQTEPKDIDDSEMSALKGKLKE